MSDIKQQELLSYVEQVKVLETELFANKQMQENFSRQIERQKPLPPTKPQRSHEPPMPEFETHQEEAGAGTLGVGGLLFLFFALAAGSFDNIIGYLLCIGFGILSLMGFAMMFHEIYIKIKNRKAKKAKQQSELAAYEKRMEEYKKRVEYVKIRNESDERHYECAVKNYSKELKEYEAQWHVSIQALYQSGSKLKDALNLLYRADIIYPKYRNLVAVTTIYEYLASGRCDKLEGPDGAYNLYEMELRQNIIIGQLASVLDSLEKIRDNQFTLYNELEYANRKSETLLSNICDNTKFSAYTNEVIAKNAEATKYYTLFTAVR